MRFFKKTVIWFIALAVIGGSFYFIDRQVEEKKVVEETKKKLFSFEPKDVIEIQLNRTKDNVLLRRNGSEWLLEKPLHAAADKEAIQKLLNAVINAKFDATLFESKSKEKLKEMGIEGADSLSVVFKTSPGLEKTVIFGDRNPTMNLGFAILKDDPRIFRLTADIKAEADKTVYDLRDKTVIYFEPLKIKGFEIQWWDSELLAVDHPAEGKWHVVKPREAVASAIKATELLYKLRDSRIKAFVDESPKDLVDYGLAKPRLKIRVTDEKGKKIELLVGERDRKQRGIFAKKGDAQNVFSLEEEFIANIPKTAAELEETEIERKPKIRD
ncbi:MAG: DUF4340 domain-containing protein [Deltaproteobacteria bacterium]|nr:DUF4340 domain-containing protein [Deltaproteobacteria bacterium]